LSLAPKCAIFGPLGSVFPRSDEWFSVCEGFFIGKMGVLIGKIGFLGIFEVIFGGFEAFLRCFIEKIEEIWLLFAIFSPILFQYAFFELFSPFFFFFFFFFFNYYYYYF
jgi:hypothetical protein